MKYGKCPKCKKKGLSMRLIDLGGYKWGDKTGERDVTTCKYCDFREVD